MVNDILGKMDLTHPAVGAVSVFSRQAGFLPVEELNAGLIDAGLPKPLLPGEVGQSTALRRAVEDAAKGNKDARVESAGKGSGAVYSIINLKRDIIDLEAHDGTGVADSVLSARMEVNGVGGQSLVISPPTHPAAGLIRDRFDFHQENYKCAEDLSKWLSQKVFKSNLIQAVPRPGHGGGMYYIPKGPGFDLVLRLKDIMMSLSKFCNKELLDGVRLYAQPVFHSFADCTDAMADALLEDFTKACDGIETYMVGYEEGNNEIRWDGLKSKLEMADQIQDKLQAFHESCGLSVADLEPRLKALKTRMVMAQVALAHD